MSIETTTCISFEHLKLLQSHAQRYDMSLRTFISGMVSFAAQCEKVSVQSFKQLSYRKKGTAWKRFHLVLFDDEYEFFMDVKKVWKMSLAKVIAYCLDNVLFEFLAILDGMGIGLHIVSEVMKAQNGLLLFPEDNEIEDYNIPAEYESGAIIILMIKKD